MIENVSAVISSLGTSRRKRLLLLLRHGTFRPIQLAHVLNVPTSSVALHLKALVRAGLARRMGHGHYTYFYLAPATPNGELIMNWVLDATRNDPTIDEDLLRLESVLQPAMKSVG